MIGVTDIFDFYTSTIWISTARSVDKISTDETVTSGMNSILRDWIVEKDTIMTGIVDGVVEEIHISGGAKVYCTHSFTVEVYVIKIIVGNPDIGIGNMWEVLFCTFCVSLDCSIINMSE